MMSVRRLLSLGGLVCLLALGGVLALSGASASAFLGYGNRTLVFGAHVDKTTGANVCAAASGDECGPGEVAAGSGQFSLNTEASAPGAGVAVDEKTHDVYVVDTFNNRIEKFTPAGAFIAAWGWGVTDGKPELEVCAAACGAGLAGSGEGEFSEPVGVAVDNSAGASAGDVYVADRGNKRIEKLSSAGVLLSQFGGPAPEYPGSVHDPDNGISLLKGGNSVYVDPTTGNVWVADAEPNDRAVQYTPSGEYKAEIVNGFQFGAFGLTVDSTGDVYVVNGGSSVEEFSPSLAFIRNVDGSNVLGTFPRAVVTGPGGEVFVGNGHAGEYETRQFPATGESTVFSQSAGSEPEPVGSSAGIALDAETGAFFIVDGAHQAVDVYDLVQLADVTTGAATNVRGTTASVEGTINPEGVEAHYHFEYGPTTAYGSTTAEEASASAGPVSVPPTSLTGLTPLTTYHYRLVAVNANGKSRGVDGEFKTGPAVAGVATGKAAPVGIATATLNGQLNPEEGVETHYRFQYGTTTAYTAPETELQTSSTEGLIAAKAAVTELEAGTTYHYRIVASSEHGETVGEDETFTTSPAVPTVTGETPFTTGVAPHEATLHGALSPGRGVTTYRFLYGVSAAYGSSTAAAYTQFNAEETAIEHEGIPITQYPAEQLITGLLPGVTYHYALSATNSSGTVTGPDETFTTLPEAASEQAPEATGPPVSGSPVTLLLPSTPALLPAILFPAQAKAPVTKTTKKPSKKKKKPKVRKKSKKKGKR